MKQSATLARSRAAFAFRTARATCRFNGACCLEVIVAFTGNFESFYAAKHLIL